MKQKKGPNNINSNFLRNLFLWIVVFIGITYFINLASSPQTTKIDYGDFYYRLQQNDTAKTIKSVIISENVIKGEFTQSEGGGNFYVYIPKEDEDLLPLIRKNVPEVEVEPPKTLWANLFYSLGPILIFIIFLWYFAYRGSRQMGGSNIWSFSKSRAQVVDKGKAPEVTFGDVAGVDEAKDELKEVVAFLRDPKRFQKLGGRIPKGVLLIGPPGCGKTLLAKAVAGEAGVVFFSISGSDFVEMFVGVGASRVRDLFEQARKAVKATKKGGIIFIDEIDAVGRQRFSGIGGGHDEREQTLNQLLTNMDGFNTEEGIIVLAATNRPDVLDPALLRPGRFDRHVGIDAPDIKGREAILKVHSRKIKLAPNIDISVIAKQTPGFSGADLENLCNEAALLAARKRKNAVGAEELQEAVERVMAGPQRKSRVISERERNIIAYHESGHALLSLLMPYADPLHKVSIVPRGMSSLGYTMQIPIEDKYIISRSELSQRLIVLLGGRASEELIFKEITTGAQNDLQNATKMARRMVTDFGMSSRLGNIALNNQSHPVFLGKELSQHQNYSDETARIIDQEVKKIVEGAYQQAKDALAKNLDKLKKLAEQLLEKEVLTSDTVKEIINFQDKKTPDTNNKTANNRKEQNKGQDNTNS